jgi:biopolymer transport protein ExbD
MGVVKPGFHLQSKYNLPSFRERIHGPVGGRNLSTDLNLTSFIDIFSTIILFLISTFSATGDILLVNKNIKLPTAQHAFMLERSPIVTVTQEGVILEGAGVGNNADIQDKIEESDWELPLLKKRLREYKAFFEAADAGVPFPGRVIIQADQDLTFLYLKRVMYTLVQEGYSAIDLVVAGEAGVRHPTPKTSGEP